MQTPSGNLENQYSQQTEIIHLDNGRPVDSGELNQIQSGLETSEADYRTIFDTANDAIFIHDAETGTILDVNRKMTEMYGYTLEEVRQLNVEALSAGAPPYTQEDALRWIRKAAQGEPQLFEWKCKDKAGRIFWGEVNLKRTSIGGVARLLAIVRDVTGHKRAEEEQARLASIVESSDDAIIGKTLDGKILSWNQGAEALYGYRAEEVIGKLVSMLAPPDRREELSHILERISRGEGVSHFETVRMTKEGAQIDVSLTISPTKNAAGEVTGAASIARDITGRKRAEVALRESEERYRRLLGSATDYIYSVKIENGCWVETSHSPGCLTVTGYSPEEYQNDPELWYRMVHPADQPAVFEQAARSRSGEAAPPLEHRIIHKDGSTRWLRNTIALHKNEQGQMISYDGLVNDITERKRTEQVLRQAEDQLRQSQKIEAIGRLAGGVAHDFNNLLTAIIGYADFLMMSLSPDDPRHVDAEEIRKASEKASTLTRQLLAFSRKQDLQPRTLDFNAVIRDSIKILQRLLGEDIELTTVLEPSLWQVKADPGQIEQVIINIAVNSRDAMPDGGKLSVQTANVNLNEEFCRQHPSTKVGPHVKLAIGDTGCGMDLETQSRIFEPFFTTKEAGKGTGLGLSTVYGIIKQSGGSIWVNSEIGKGTVFEIYLPRVEIDHQVPDSRPMKSPIETVTGTESILLVEDETVVRNLVRDALKRCGYKVLEAHNGKEALRLSSEHDGPIQLMLTDLVMPEINGRLLAERLATVRPNMRVLYMSGYSASAIAHLGISNPEELFLQKPFSPDMLVRRIREVLDSPR